MAEKVKFLCPICGSTEYGEKTKTIDARLGPGHRTERVYCYCQGCTVVFLDPEKFSRANKKK